MKFSKSSWIGVLVLATTTTISFAGEPDALPPGLPGPAPVIVAPPLPAVYVREGWEEEGMLTYKSLRNQARKGLVDGSATETDTCSLPKGTIVKLGDVECRTYTLAAGKGIALKDLSVELYLDVGVSEIVPVKAGEQITELGYVAEGICEFEVNGKRGQSECLNNYPETELKKVSDTYSVVLVRVNCAGGNAVWLSEEQLSEPKFFESDVEF